MREQAYQQLTELISMVGGVDGRKKLQKLVVVFYLKSKEVETLGRCDKGERYEYS
ncbi:MAG TPA: hypothetical protein VKN82_01030 [Desulfohalobiaceae bacterium]|nr:hypothetical protein [Desulfohalobiaceae bacterium]